MGKKYCSQLGNLPINEKDIYKPDRYICKITRHSCIASTYEDPDPGHPASLGDTASYSDYKAANCLGYDLSDEIANRIKKHRLEIKKAALEKEIKQIDANLKE